MSIVLITKCVKKPSTIDELIDIIREEFPKAGIVVTGKDRTRIDGRT